MTQNVQEPYLNISDPLLVDESVSEYKYDVFNPIVGSDLNHPATIKILIADQAAYYLPSESYLTIKGKFMKTDGTKLADTNLVTLTNNSPMFLFDKMEYQIGDTTVESIHSPGHASLMKGLFSYPKFFGECGGISSGWELDYNPEDSDSLDLSKKSGFKVRHRTFNKQGKFNVSFVIPLGHIFGFCEEYKKMIFGCRHTLVLNRCGDKNAIVKGGNTEPDCKFEITHLSWTMPRIYPNLEIEMKLTDIIKSKSVFPIGFLYRSLNQISVPENTRFTWQMGMKASTEKPRYFIIGFQTNKFQNYENAAVFDHCNLKSITVYLNSDQYPNITITNDFENADFTTSYHMAKKFRQNYYKLTDNYNDFMIDFLDFKTFYPLFVIDASKQNDRLKNSISDVRIEAEFKKSVPANTICYCLTLSDRMIKLVSDGGKFMLQY